MDNGFDPKRDTQRNLFKPLGVALGALLMLGGLAAVSVLGNGGDGAKDATARASGDTPASMASLFHTQPEDHRIAPMIEGPRVIRTEAVKRGQTLDTLLDSLGIGRSDAYAAMNAAFDAGHLDARKIRPGLDVTAYLRSGEEPDLIGITFKPDANRSITVSRNSDGDFVSRELKTRLIPTRKRIAGTIETSLYNSARTLGANDQQVVDYAQIFAYDIDFQRELRVGDQFEMVYETYTDERGTPIRSGDILYASFNGKVLDRAFYRFTPADDGVTDYFDLKGEGARKFLMKTPINGARLSSGFGTRRHPISGYTRLHKGTDFAAPTGTPIMAAGNGVVERASRYGGYGHYVRLRHANGFQTAYAHLSRYGAGIKKGRRVRQGDIIGYVGSTGASTGPHLHYEVIKNGKHLNAMTLKLPTGRKLDGDILKAFQTRREAIDAIRASLGADLTEATTVALDTPGDQAAATPTLGDSAFNR